MTYRVGNGIDIHSFTSGKPFILGGITIPHEKGLEGHSDGDALTHSICDALLGATNKGDIGQYFPATPDYKNISSLLLLEKVNKIILQEGASIENIDVTIVLQEPKITGHIPAMKRELCHCLGIEENRLSIKATTADYLGFVGRKEGLAAFTTVLVKIN